jgi:HEPN domain-containing protein
MKMVGLNAEELPPRPDIEVARDILELAWKAKNRAASCLDGPVPIDIASVCFWGNHAVELALKAFCKSHGEKVTITHSLILLCKICIRLCKEPNEKIAKSTLNSFLSTDKFKVLDNFSDFTRYGHGTKNDNMRVRIQAYHAHAAKKIANEIFDFVFQELFPGEIPESFLSGYYTENYAEESARILFDVCRDPREHVIVALNPSFSPIERRAFYSRYRDILENPGKYGYDKADTFKRIQMFKLYNEDFLRGSLIVAEYMGPIEPTTEEERHIVMHNGFLSIKLPESPDAAFWLKPLIPDRPAGHTIAHIAAASGGLPAGFAYWDIADETGWTVAHEATKAGNLPDGFEQWDLCNDIGWTVAHEAAMRGNLPENADDDVLALEDASGGMVAELVLLRDERHGGVPDVLFDKAERLVNRRDGQGDGDRPRRHAEKRKTGPAEAENGRNPE